MRGRCVDRACNGIEVGQGVSGGGGVWYKHRCDMSSAHTVHVQVQWRLLALRELALCVSDLWAVSTVKLPPAVEVTLRVD